MEILLSQIRNNKAKEFVGEEIEAHIDDQAEVYMEFGIDKDTAEKKAVCSMGDPVETGVSLDSIHKPKISWSMIALVAILSVAGLIIQCLAGIEMGEMYFFKRQLIYVIVGFAAMLAICMLDYSRIVQHGKILAVVYLILCLVFMFNGSRHNGSHLYLHVGGITISYHFILYLSIPLFGILLYQYRKQSLKYILIPAAFIAVVIWIYWINAYGIVMLANLVFMAGIVMTYAIAKDWYPVKKKRFLAVMWTCLIGIPTAMIAGMVANAHMSGPGTYLAARLSYFLSSQERYAAFYGQYQPIGDILEKTLLFGSSMSAADKSGTALNVLSDYVLLHVSAFYGTVFLLIIIALLAVFCVKLFHLSVAQKNQVGTIIGVSCGLIFAVQIVEYVLMNLGMIPGTTAFLPLFSYGGSGTLVSYILLGLLLSIYRYQNLVTEKKLKRKKIVMKIVEM